ncbi:MAG: PAS domain S-box protein [Gammaproteobacteria bacterium]
MHQPLPKLQPSATPNVGDVFTAGLLEAATRVTAATGDAVFDEVARAVANLFDADIAFVGLRAERPEGPFIETCACWMDGQPADNIAYPLAGTPCEDVVGREFRYFPSDVCSGYADSDLIELRIQAYAGLPLIGADGRALGLIVAMSRRTLAHAAWIEPILRLFAERVTSEVERRSASIALRDAEESYRAIFDAAEDPIFVHDPASMRIVDVNAKACDVYGYSREEFAGVTVADISSGLPSFTADDAEYWIDVVKREGIAEFEWHRRNRDGSLHWDEVRLKAATIGGRPRILAFTREITDRKHAEDALRASEAMYRAIFNASMDGFALARQDGTLVDVNDALAAMTGFDRDEFVGRNAVTFLPPEHRAEGAAFLRDVFDKGYARAEQKARAKDGHELRFEPRGVPVHYQGEPHALIVMRDITEARAQQRALMRSESRLRATIEAALDCIVAMDERGRVIDFNPAAVRLFGRPAETAAGQSFVELLVAPADRARVADEMSRAVAEMASPRAGRRIEIACLDAAGREIPMELALGIARTRNLTIAIAYLHDLSERRASERAHTELEQQLRQAQKMEAVGQLTGGIAHDFNNILTSIIGYIDLARETDASDGEDGIVDVARFLQRARRAAKRAQDLVQQMLTYSRGSRGEARPVQVRRLVGEVLSMLEATLPASVQIEVEGSEELPVVSLDPVHATQALMNLCINARDAMHGRGVLTVELRQREVQGARCASCRHVIAGEFVEIGVSDTGEGMTPELLERIFDPFFSTKPQGKGSGMGLATTHGIVHQYGGHVLVESTPGAGTTFRLLLPPGIRAHTDESEPAPPEPRAVRRPLSGHVLVVDDNPAVGEFMRDLLSRWGLKVTFVQHALRASALFHQNPQAFRFVLLDQTMPEKSGLELARGMLAAAPEIPVMIYTGYSDALTEDAVVASGCRALLRKPVDTARLRAIAEEICAAA